MQFSKASLDRYITGNYGEKQIRGQAAWEEETDRLLDLRAKALKANSGFQVQQAEAELDQMWPLWRTECCTCTHEVNSTCPIHQKEAQP